MKNAKTKSRVWIVLCAAAVLCVAALCIAAYRLLTPTFQGSRIKNPDAYVLEIERMNGTDSHTLELQKSDILQIQFETEEGSLQMDIQSEDGSSIYQGNGKEMTHFKLTIPRDGCYTVLITAKQAKGTVRVTCKEDAS